MKRLFMTALLFLGIGQHAVWAQSEPIKPAASTATWWTGSIWDDPDRTYQWYPPDPLTPQAPDQAKKPGPKSPPDLRSIKTVEALKKEVDRLRDKAIMSAAPKDVQAFLAAQQFLLEKSSVFADVARRVVWNTPDIDYSLRHPTDGMAIQAYNYGERVQQEQAISDAMKHYGVYFFMSSTCPYCRMEAQALKQLEMTTGLQVLPISLNGQGIPGYAHPLPDNGISKMLAQRFGLEQLSTPALFLVPKDNPGAPPIPISFGMASTSEIMERIYALTQTQPGQQF